MATRGLDRRTMILPGIKSTLNNYHNVTRNRTDLITCHSDAESEAVILMVLAGLGMSANMMLLLMIIIMMKKALRR